MPTDPPADEPGDTGRDLPSDADVDGEELSDEDLLEDGEPVGLLLPIRAVYRLDDGSYFVALPPPFRELLGIALRDLAERITAEDAMVGRLFPSAYREHADLEEEWQRLMHGELVESRLSGIEVVEASLMAETLDEEQAVAWMQAANALRLLLGVELGIDDDDWELPEDDPRVATYELYSYLGYLVGSIVDALSAGLPD